MNSIIKRAGKVVEELNQSNKNSGVGGKKGRQHIKARLGESVNYKWETKEMYGRYIGSTDSQLISNKDMFLWLLRGDLKQKLKVKRQRTRSGITNKILCNQDITNRN